MQFFYNIICGAIEASTQDGNLERNYDIGYNMSLRETASMKTDFLWNFNLRSVSVRPTLGCEPKLLTGNTATDLLTTKHQSTSISCESFEGRTLNPYAFLNWYQ